MQAAINRARRLDRSGSFRSREREQAARMVSGTAGVAGRARGIERTLAIEETAAYCGASGRGNCRAKRCRTARTC